MGRRRRRSRDRFTLLRDALSVLDRPSCSWEVVRMANLNFTMWARMRDWLRHKEFIEPLDEGGRGTQWVRTEKGEELLRRIEAVLEMTEELR